MRALKKAVVMRSSTEDTWALTANSSEDINVTRWINDTFPDWTSSTKLFLDMPSSVYVDTLSGFNKIAVKFGGERELYSSRSLATTGQHKRNTLVLTFPAGFDTEQPTFYELLGELMTSKRLLPLMCWDSLQECPDRCYVVDVDDYSCFLAPALFGFFKQAMPLSPYRLVIELDPLYTSTDFVDELVAYNEAHPDSGPNALRLLLDNSLVWRRPKERARGIRRPKGAPPPHVSDTLITMERCPPSRVAELMKHWLNGSVSQLIETGFTPQDVEFTIHPFIERGQVTNNALITGMKMGPLRALCYPFRRFTWASSKGDYILIPLQNQELDEEIAHNSSLRFEAASARANMGPEDAGRLLAIASPFMAAQGGSSGSGQ